MDDETGSRAPEDPPGQELRYIRGVGPRRAEKLRRMGMYTAADLLLTAPRQHEDRRQLTAIAELRPGVKATCSGELLRVRAHALSGRRHLISAMVADESGKLEVVWFNQAYLADRFEPGQRLILTGKVDLDRGSARMNSPEFEVIEEVNPSDDFEGSDETPYAQLAFGRLVPIYPLTEGVGQRFMRRLAWKVVEEYAAGWPELFSDSFRSERRLITIADALRGMHFPDDGAHARAARRRMVYEELLVLQLVLALRRARLAERGPVKRFKVTERVDARIRSRLKFTLTADQERTIAEIVRDLDRERPMNRLLQGEVGSGKTAVAAYACLAAVAGGSQAAVMAPTEVLAEQHYRVFSELLEGSRVRIVLLSGSVKPAERKRRVALIAAGDADIVIATHAVIQQQVSFKELGLVVLDEQHKFGVAQRSSLARKGPAPHVLVMSATPIPRTLAQAFYTDLDLSAIHELPGGARKVTTRVVTERSRNKVLEFVGRRLGRGERAYVIYPAISENEETDLAAAETGYRELSQRFGSDHVGLLHGRMKADEKRAVMERFRSGEVSVLVATTVVEVGVDVPEATVIVVEGAERFGLATLHQLRGRVGRGKQKRAWCLCIARTRTRESMERLRAFAATQDGFKIAEEDFKLRGPGQFLGERQHGLPELRFADLVEDGEMVELARRDALAIVKSDPKLSKRDHRALGKRIERLVAASPELVGVA
jgi:ATP-dependent DNA helicase RecG